MKPLLSAMIGLALLSGAAQADGVSDRIQDTSDVAKATHFGGSWTRSMALRYGVKSDPLPEWIAIALNIARESGQTPAQSLRAVAAVHMAVFEALNFVEPRYTSRYVVRSSGFPGIPRDAVMAGAAHHVLSQLYPEHNTALDAYLRASLGAMEDIPNASTGALTGKSIAAIIWALRPWEEEMGARIGSDLAVNLHLGVEK